MQIYRVNKRLNNYQKKNKPKIQITENTLNFNAGGGTQAAFGSPTSAITNEVLNANATLFRLHSCTLSFVITTYSRLQDIVLEGLPCVYMRVLVFQYKAGHSNVDTSAWSLYPVTQQNFQSQDAAIRKATTFQCIFGPLKQGITGKLRILRDFKLFYGVNNADKANKRCVMKRLQNVRVAPDKTYPAGSIFWSAVWWTNYIGQGVDSKQLKFYIYQKTAYSVTR